MAAPERRRAAKQHRSAVVTDQNNARTDMRGGHHREEGLRLGRVQGDDGTIARRHVARHLLGAPPPRARAPGRPAAGAAGPGDPPRAAHDLRRSRFFSLFFSKAEYEVFETFNQIGKLARCFQMFVKFPPVLLVFGCILFFPL